MSYELVRRFGRDTRGNFAMLAGIAGIVLTAAIGGAVDLSQQAGVRASAQRAVDAAALAGAKEMEAGTVETAKVRIQTMATANLDPALPPLIFDPVIDPAAGTVTVTAKGTMQPNFLKLLSIDTLPVEATATASIQHKSYTDFYFLLDVSESMNIAATEADRKKLEDYTRLYYKDPFGRRDRRGQPIDARPCAFACHQLEGDSTFNVYERNRSFVGARLRIDVLRDAADGMIDQILALNAKPDTMKSMRIATAGFSEDFEVGMMPSTDAKNLKDSIDNFRVANQHTNLNAALDRFADQLGTQGRGSSVEDAQKVALIVTDGVRDEKSGWMAFQWWQIGTVDQAVCKKIKNKGIKLAILEIRYLELDDQYGYFRDRVRPYYDKLPSSLKDCASNGLYHQADDASGAQAALLALTDNLLSVKRHLTQ